jgi:hypothetical protein
MAESTLWWLATGGLVAVELLTGTFYLLMMALGLAAAVGAFVFWVRHRRIPMDLHKAALQIERRYPELDTLLLAALAQSAPEGQKLNYLQQRVVEAARDHSRKNRWLDAVPRGRMRLAHALHWGALALFAVALTGIRVPNKVFAENESPAGAGVFVSPGDTNIEKGRSLVVLARFSGALPSKVDLVLEPAQSATNRIAMLQNLADPVFGGGVLDLASSFEYRIEYGGKSTRLFKVGVFEYPRLERADADLVFPDYTGAARKRIEDTRRISAVEGSRLDLALQLNKPVAQARLVGKDKSVVALTVDPLKAAVSLRQMPLAKSMNYELQLVDADGRTNKTPASFAIDVLPNRPAQLKLASPRGDLRPSPLEEIRFEGEVWDDFGIRAYGLAYTLGGGETTNIALGSAVPGGQKKPFSLTLRLEDLGVKPDDLISYHLWAEDTGPDGQIRRQTSDIFFAEVRPFDEIFRQGQSQDGGQQENQEEQAQGGEGNQSARLAELQKQIISATWKLRQHGASATGQYLKDAPVVRDSQAQALTQAETAGEKATDPKQKASWDAAIGGMSLALKRLNEATNSPTPLPAALSAEQTAYQALLKLQAREHEVARNRSRGRNSGGEQAQSRQQLNQMELAESENRYETQSQAAPKVSEERRENLQALNRLQELAKRQQDLNERLKELQTALQEANSEAAKEEIRRRLKRLREQEQEMVENSDELRQRMEQGENQRRMASEREQLDRAREQMRNTSEAIDKGSVSQALASGTRAERELQEMRDNLRKQSASQFSEEMRQMRGDARALSQKQEEIAREMEALQNRAARTLSDAPQRQQLQERLNAQREKMTNLLAGATQISQQSETAEPLLSRQLYETIRKLSQEEERNTTETQAELLRQRQLTKSIYDSLNQQDGQGKSLKITGELLRQGSLPQAGAVEKRARAAIDQLRTGVERAAESVLGDETEALRMAQKELDNLAEQANQEMNRAEQQDGAPAKETAESGQSGRAQAQAQSPDAPPASGANRTQAQNQTPGENRAEAQNRPQDQPGQPGNNPQGGRRQASPLRQNAQGGDRQQDRAETQAPSRNGGADRGGSRPNAAEDLSNNGGVYRSGPITGENFAPWSDRLREVEEMLDQPDLRQDVASAREAARRARLEFKRNLKKPDWANVRLKVIKPLLEVRNRIAEDLARREPGTALAPIDRDPVPNRYSELVRRYYEELGKDNTKE